MAPSEMSVLTALYNSTGGNAWSDKQGWADYISAGSGADPCVDYWVGVVCTGGAPNHVSYVAWTSDWFATLANAWLQVTERSVTVWLLRAGICG